MRLVRFPREISRRRSRSETRVPSLSGTLGEAHLIAVLNKWCKLERWLASQCASLHTHNSVPLRDVSPSLELLFKTGTRGIFPPLALLQQPGPLFTSHESWSAIPRVATTTEATLFGRSLSRGERREQGVLVFDVNYPVLRRGTTISPKQFSSVREQSNVLGAQQVSYTRQSAR